MSPDYYAKIEQTRRGLVPSDSVLRALAAVLQLDEAAKEHMYDLAQRDLTAEQRGGQVTQSAGAGMLRMMESLGDLPAILLGRRTDILAANRAARRLFGDFSAIPVRDRNAVKLVLLDDHLRHLVRHDWEAVASGLVGMFRMDAGKYPNDQRTAELVDELGEKSELFNFLWTKTHVARGIESPMVVDHPVVGRLRLHLESMNTARDRGRTLHVMIPESDLASQPAARRLPESGRREIATSPRRAAPDR